MSVDIERLIAQGALEDAARELEKAPDTRLMLRLAAALLDHGRGGDAQAWYQRILEIEPDNGDALLCLAVAREDADIEAARSVMGRYIQARPRDAAGHLRRALMLPAITDSSEHIERITQRLETELDQVLDGGFSSIRQPEFEVGATPFFLAYYGRNPRLLLTKVARACRAVYPARTECPHKLFSNGKRLRIGFISTNFHEHSVAKTMYGFARDLPRERYEVVVFAIAPRPDRWNELMRGAADRYQELPLDLTRCREAISAAKLDVAFFTDIGMDPLTYFLAFWRLAPLQLTSWGHSVTSGIDTIDYYVSHDLVELPGAQDHYSERLLRLPGYWMPRYLKPALAGARPSRGRKRTYHCAQNLFKFHPDFDATLKAILDRDVEAELVLVDSGRPWTAQLRSRLRRTLGASLEARVRVAPRMAHREFLQHLAAADVVLDPFYFSGCNSSLDAFALGLPIVTRPGFLLPGRFTLGLYQEMQIEGCVARTPEEYVEIALRLATESDYRAALLEKIGERAERLFDRADCGMAFGDALWKIAEERR